MTKKKERKKGRRRKIRKKNKKERRTKRRRERKEKEEEEEKEQKGEEKGKVEEGKEDLLPLPEIDPRSLGRAACNLSIYGPHCTDPQNKVSQA